MLPLLLIAPLLQGPVEGCGPDAWLALSRAAERRERGGAADAAAVLVGAVRETPDCVPLAVAGWAMTGWLQARAAVAKGGAPDTLGAVRASLEVLVEMTSRSSWRVQNDYARAAITAAIAAAQDERPEMSVYLSHARGLSDRLLLTNERVEWPLPIDEMEGELWLEVDRYADSREAYQRAVASGGGASALVGLARVHDRLRDERGACDAYRRALAQAEGTLAAEAGAYLDRPGCRE